MYLLGILTIFLTLALDVMLRMTIGSFVLQLQLSHLFLFYCIFRRSFRYTATLLVIYVLLVRPFSGIGSQQIFLSSILVLWIFFKIRTEIFTESYLIQAVWIIIMAFCQQVTLMVIDYGSLQWTELPGVLMSIVISCLFSGILVIPTFLIWDRIFDRVRSESRDEDGVIGQGIIRGRRGSGDLL